MTLLSSFTFIITFPGSLDDPILACMIHPIMLKICKSTLIGVSQITKIHPNLLNLTPMDDDCGLSFLRISRLGNRII